MTITTTIKTTSYNRNGTHLRVLIAVPNDQIDTIQVHRLTDDLALHTTRIVLLAAPTLDDLDRHTERLQNSARIVHWELVSADGVHQEIISALANRHLVEP